MDFDVLALKGTKKILMELGKKGSLRYSELVNIVGFSTTTTRALKAMEKMGLVDKKALTEPYRPVAYSLTEKGRKLVEIARQLKSL